MWYIKDIFKSCVCSFCENIYEYDSIDTNEFIESLRSFLREDDLQNCLKVCTSEIAYDIVNIDNVCNNLPFLKYNQSDEEKIVDICKSAYIQTLENDKTINIEAFVDNLARNFSK